MRNKKFVFAGNRFYVLEQMLLRELNLVHILAVRDSYLQHVLEQKGIEFTVVESKGQLIETIEATDFDYFVANGCPYILPITQLSTGEKKFVNVHPSPLPDLRGADPVPGALLHERDAGATCHVMDDGIDTGGIIARVVIPNTPDLECGLLYQLSFLAEAEVFHAACERGFKVATDNPSGGDTIYYTRREEDLEIDFDEPTSKIVARVRAWSTRSQGARFHLGEHTFRVMAAEEVTNPYVMTRLDDYEENEVVFRYETSLLIRHGTAFLKLASIEGDLSLVEPGQILSRPPAV
jgi:methionyl-tRNA formyltransferase